MVFRISGKLGRKLHLSRLPAEPLAENPYCDWSAHLFTANRRQYIIVTNTVSLYSVVLPGRGIADDVEFIGRALPLMREMVCGDGFEFLFRKFIGPATGSFTFAKALNRSVTGSMNDLVYHAKVCLAVKEMAPSDTAQQLNGIPFQHLAFIHPRETFQKMGMAADSAGEKKRPETQANDDTPFTPAALAHWRLIPPELQKQLLANVWCGGCGGAASIVIEEALMNEAVLVLRGRCAVCGHPVCRSIEPGGG